MQVLFYPNDLKPLLKDLVDFKVGLFYNPGGTLKKVEQEIPELLTDSKTHDKNLTLILGVARSLPELPNSVAYLSSFLIALELGLLYLAKSKNTLRELFDNQKNFEIIDSQLEQDSQLKQDKDMIQDIMQTCSLCLEQLYRLLASSNNSAESPQLQETLLAGDAEKKIIKNIFSYFGLEKGVYLDKDLYRRYDQLPPTSPIKDEINKIAMDIVHKKQACLSAISSTKDQEEPIIVEYNRGALLQSGLREAKKEMLDVDLPHGRSALITPR